MTCAHVVYVALKKLPGVETVEVSLNKGMATVKLKPGNSLSVPEFWQTIHTNGYTPKNTTVSVRGELSKVQGQMKLKVSGTNGVLALTQDPKSQAAFRTAESKSGQTAIVQGVMVPLKDFKTPVPLEVLQIQ